MSILSVAFKQIKVQLIQLLWLVAILGHPLGTDQLLEREESSIDDFEFTLEDGLVEANVMRIHSFGISEDFSDLVCIELAEVVLLSEVLIAKPVTTEGFSINIILGPELLVESQDWFVCFRDAGNSNRHCFQ